MTLEPELLIIFLTAVATLAANWLKNRVTRPKTRVDTAAVANEICREMLEEIRDELREERLIRSNLALEVQKLQTEVTLLRCFLEARGVDVDRIITEGIDDAI